MMTEETKIAACSQRYYEIHQTDLPLCCPMPNMEIWNAHPRVYLDVMSKDEVLCPYCSTTYTLVD